MLSALETTRKLLVCISRLVRSILTSLGAFAAALEHIDGPTLLALSRQNLPNLETIDVNVRRDGVLRGGTYSKYGFPY